MNLFQTVTSNEVKIKFICHCKVKLLWVKCILFHKYITVFFQCIKQGQLLCWTAAAATNDRIKKNKIHKTDRWYLITESPKRRIHCKWCLVVSPKEQKRGNRVNVSKRLAINNLSKIFIWDKTMYEAQKICRGTNIILSPNSNKTVRWN